jgi:WD40 repeat protein/tRNA A-37 threonylcarbamoyl transferase component Bud32
MSKGQQGVGVPSEPRPEPGVDPLAAPTLLKEPGKAVADENAATLVREPAGSFFPSSPLRPDRTSTDVDDEPPPIAAAAAPTSYPDRIGPYEILEEIARGGMGVVFKARHLGLQRIVALKMVLNGQLANKSNLERFHLEARATAQLQHPGIVHIYEVNATAEGQPFFSMEYIDGVSLAQRVEDGPLPSVEAARYLEKTARAVHFAHVRGNVLHRDLKPANILLDEHDNPKVTDFGLAKVLENDSSNTRTGAIMGTPSYMAPEQALAKRNLTAACDVYSLGAILYELLTGRPPFQGETAMATMTMVIEQEPVPPRMLNPKVDPDLETICLKCLEKEPSRRYESAEALANDLRNFLAGEPIAAKRTGPIGRAWKWCRRKPTAAALVVVSALLVAGLIASAIGYAILTHNAYQAEYNARLDAQRARDEADEQRQLAERALAQAERSERAMRHVLYNSEFRSARFLWESANLQRAEDNLDAIAVSEKLDPRCWEWYFLKSQCASSATLRPSGEVADPVKAIAYSPNGKWVATGHQFDGTIRLWDASSGKCLRILGNNPDATQRGHHENVRFLSFSPDGKTLVSIGDFRTQNQPPENPNAPVHPRPKVARKSEVFCWDVESGRRLLDLTKGSDFLLPASSAAAFNADGSIFAAASMDRKIHLWNPRTGAAIRTLDAAPVHQNRITAIAFDPAGRLATVGEAIAGRRGGLDSGEWCIWHDPATGDDRDIKDLIEGSPFSAVVFGPKAAPGTNLYPLVLGGKDGSLRSILPDPDDPKRMPTTIYSDNQDRRITWIAISANGDRLFASFRGPGSQAWGSIQCWERTTAAPAESWNERFRYAWQRDFGECVALSRDGKRLASAIGDGFVRLWNVAGGLEAQGLEGHHFEVASIAFSPDGSRLVSVAGDEVFLWNAATGENIRKVSVKLRGASQRCNAVAFHDSGKLIALAGADGDIHLLEANLEKRVATLSKSKEKNGAAPPVLSIAFGGPNGDVLAATDWGGNLSLWSIATRKLLKEFKAHESQVRALAVSHDGMIAATGGEIGTQIPVRFWNLSTFEEIIPDTPMLHDGSIKALAFDPGGRGLAVACGDKTVKLWLREKRENKLHAFRLWASFEGHTGIPVTVGFDVDGYRVISAGDDHTVRFWDRIAKAEILRLDAGLKPIKTLAVSSDGETIAAAGTDRVIRLWRAPRPGNGR